MIGSQVRQGIVGIVPPRMLGETPLIIRRIFTRRILMVLPCHREFYLLVLLFI